MAANNIGKWSGQATLDAGGFSAGVKAMEKSAQQARQGVGKQFKGLEQSIESVTGGIGASIRFGNFALGFSNAGLAIGLQMGRQLASSVMGTIDKEVEFGFLNDQIGTSIEWLSGFRTVASEAGISGDRFTSAIGRLHQTLGNAALGSSEARGAFRNIGLTWDDLAGQNFDDQLLRISDAMGATENRAVRARVATELFGREGGRQFIRLMQGAGGLSAAIAEVQSRGGIMTTGDLQAMQRANDSIDRLTTRFEQLQRGAAVAGVRVAEGWQFIIAALSRGHIQNPIQEELARVEAQERALAARILQIHQERIQAQVEMAADAATDWAGLQARLGDGWLNQPQQGADVLVRDVFNGALNAAQMPRPAAPAGAEGAAGLQVNIGLTDQLANATRALNAEMLAQAAMRALAPEQVNANNVAFEQQIGALRVQAATLGMSAEAAQRFKNELAGMTAEQLRQIDVINSAIAARNAQIANEQNAMNQIQQMTQAARTPLMDFQRDMRRIFSGGLGAREMGANIEQAIGRLGMQQPQRSRVAGMEQGSVEAVSLINQRDTAQISAIDRVRETLQTAIRVQEAQRDFQRDTLDAVRQLRRGGEFADVLGN